MRELLAAWLRSFPNDGRCWARPCPACGWFYTLLRANVHAGQHLGGARA